jgi:hypothetical protein
MEILGLSGPREEPENILKRIFWPGNRPSEADLLSQRGFWVCLGVALLTLISLIFQGHWLVGLYAGLIYFLGGLGVREHSFKAAVLITLAFGLDILSIILTGRFPGFLVIGAFILLMTNLRGTWIVSQAKATMEPDTLPTRLNQTWTDQLVDQMPARMWPRARVIFYIGVGLYLVLQCVGIVAIAFKIHPTHL